MPNNLNKICVVLAVLFVSPCYAQDTIEQTDGLERCHFPEGRRQVEMDFNVVALCLGETHVTELEDFVGTIVIGNENVLTVSPISQRVFVVIPRSPGDTTVQFFDPEGILLARRQFVIGSAESAASILAPSSIPSPSLATAVDVMVETMGSQMIYRCQGACERMGN